MEEHKCEEDWFGNCYICGRNMLDKKEGIEEYGDEYMFGEYIPNRIKNFFYYSIICILAIIILAFVCFIVNPK